MNNNKKLNLKISEEQKYANDGEWFKDFMEYIVPSNNAIINDYDVMKTSYAVANNDLSGFKKKLFSFCSPLGEDSPDITDDMIPYPELHNKINVIKGELLRRNDQHKIMLLTSKAIQDKNDELFNLIKASVDEKLAIELEKQKMQMKGMTQEQIQQYTEGLRTKLEPEDYLNKNWMSEIEIFYSKALRYCMQDQNVKLKKMETMEDVLIADRCFIYSGWKYGKPYLEIRNPLSIGFHKNPNEKFIHKGDWIWHKKAITQADAINNYNLSDEDVSNLGMSNNSGLDKRHNIFDTQSSRPVFDTSVQDMMIGTNSVNTDKAIGLNTSNETFKNNSKNLIWETHLEFKAFKELIFLSYTDEYNKEVNIILSNKFDIPSTATKEKFINSFGEKSERYVWFDEVSNTEYRAEKLWIPRKYEIIRLGNNVYPIYREVPYQYTNIEQPYSTFELSTKGAIFNGRNAQSVSLLQRALAPYFQLIYIKMIQNRELSKYQGAIQDIDVDQIPDSLGQDIDGNPIRDKVSAFLSILKKTNKNIYSGSQTSFGGLPPATRSPGSSGFQLGTAVELMNLQNLIEYVKREIGMAMGISPQREASFDNNSNVSDNRQAITQSNFITEPYFFIHSEIWKSVLNDYLINFRTYCENQLGTNKKELSIHYYMPDGTAELLKVTPSSLCHSDIGLFLTSGDQSQQYADNMMQLVHAFAQNAGEGIVQVSQIIKDISSGASPEEIHKRIQIEEKKQQDRQQQIQQAEQQAKKEQIQMEIDSREDIQKHEIDLAVTKAVENRITQLQVANITEGNKHLLKEAEAELEQQFIELEREKMQNENENIDKKLQVEKTKIAQKK